MVARFGERSCWEAREVRVRHGCGIWKSISAIKEMFWKYIRFHLGSGVSIRFWEDIWVGDSPLKDNFLNIFRLALDPRASVSNCFDASRWVWDLGLCRNPNDWEVGELIRMLGLLGNFEPIHNGLDRWIWILNREGKFNSKSFYEETLNVLTSVIPFKGIWNAKIPSKVFFFIWTTFLNKILALNHLQSRGWNLVNRCILCMEEE